MTEQSVIPTPEGFVRTTFQRRLTARETICQIRSAGELVTPADRDEQYEKLRKMIGKTPLLRVAEVQNGSRIFAKVESQNPSESHYDRAYLLLLNKLEKDGIIKPGYELLEDTSGSAGTSFAWLCSCLGYQARIIIPPELPQARIQEMINFRANLEISEPGYMRSASKALRRKLVEYRRQGYDIKEHVSEKEYQVFTATKEGHRICAVNHSASDLTIKAFSEIGTEVGFVMPEDTKIDFFVSVLGSWTSTTGVAEGLRQKYPNVEVVGLEDKDNAPYFNQKYPGRYEEVYGQEPSYKQHDNYGGSDRGVPLRFADVSRVDSIELVDSAERKGLRDRFNAPWLHVAETIGNTSAASLVVAERLALENPGSNVLVLFYDKGDRYDEMITEEEFSHRTSPIGQMRLIPQQRLWLQPPAEKMIHIPRRLGTVYNRVGVQREDGEVVFLEELDPSPKWW